MFYPTRTETISSPGSRSEVRRRLTEAITPPINEYGEEGKKWFNGACAEDAFEISLFLKRPNNYVPVISGLMEPDDDGGTIILVKYNMFPASKNLLLFWTVLTLLITLFFSIPYSSYSYAAISFSACFVNYLITYENFKIQVRKSRRALEKVLA